MQIRPLLLLLLLSMHLISKAQAKQDTIQYSSDTIQLQEVIVTAQENRSIQTSSVLSKEAIGHVQPFSLTDLMQLLPGGVTPAVSLHTPQYFRLRSITAQDATNALGTGIWVDGIRAANNANLQLDILSGTNAEHGYTGIDTRSLPVGNIESVEVVRGIPSARYGDITSGAVIIRSRAALEPLTFEGRITPRIKSIRSSKGWATGNNGILNLFADFTRSQADLRSRENLFHKAGVQAAWSGVAGNLSLNARFSGSFATDAAGKENNRQQDEYTRARRQSFNAGIYGTWTANRKAVTTLEYRLSGSYARQKDEQQRKHIQMLSVGTTHMESGEHTGFFIPPQYLSMAKIDGRPAAATAAVTVRLLRKGSRWSAHTSLGGEWSSEGNRGQGRRDNPQRPSTLWSRPWPYREIPFLHHAALFAEENFSFRFSGGTLALQAGIRLAGAATRSDNFPLSVEPRLNLRYRTANHITLKAGWGRLRKMPALAYLYPPPAYHDYISYRYNDDNTGQSLAVLTTDLVRQYNGNIRLPKNDKMELGFIVRTAGIETDVTVFREQLRYGFSVSKEVRPSAYRIYQNDNLLGIVPEYTDNGVIVNGQPAAYTTDTAFIHYSRTSNQLSQRKYGIEFVVRTGRWDALASTLVIDGAWIWQEDRTEGTYSRIYNVRTDNKSYPFAPIYEQATATLSERLNTNFRIVTQLPELRLISTFTLQTVWTERRRIRYESRQGRQVYMKDKDGNRIDGDIYSDNQHNKYIDPLFFMDTHGTLHTFTTEMASDSRYKQMPLSQSPYTYLPDSYRPYFLINLRITKEIGRHLRLTVYANNIANINPSRFTASGNSYNTMNPPAFYGAELQIKL